MEPLPDNPDWIGAALARYGPALARYAASIVGDPDTARDVVQDTFVRLCRADPGQLDGHLAEWLFTVCRHRALDMQRHHRRLTALPDPDETEAPHPDPSPDAAAEHHDTARLALELLRSLPPRQQEVVRLKFQAGLSYAEIAGVTRLSVANVGFILHSALKTLRRRMLQAL